MSDQPKEILTSEIIAKAALFDEMFPALQSLLHWSCNVALFYRHDGLQSGIIDTNTGELLHQSQSFTACLEWIRDRAKAARPAEDME